MGLFKRRNKDGLSEYIDDISTKIACTYAFFISSKQKVIQDKNLRLLAEDKIKLAAISFAICSVQKGLTDTERDMVMPILLDGISRRLKTEIFARGATSKDEEKIRKIFLHYLEKYLPRASDTFKLFRTLAEDLNMRDDSGEILMQTIQVTEVMRAYTNWAKLNEFPKKVNELL